MAIEMNHIHLKTPDPQKTAQFYMDALGAKIVGELGTYGLHLDLHGLRVNLTKHIEDQTREQKYGIEHLAVDTDDIDKVIAGVKAGGGRILEEMQGSSGKRTCFVEGPDGVQVEVIEIAK